MTGWAQKIRCDYLLLGLALILNGFVWWYASPKIPAWANVPPAPSRTGALVSFLGDSELAYRSFAITIQQFGNTTGQVMALKDYNYQNLGTWFDLEDSLNRQSDYVPFLAGYYFGANQDPSQLMPVITYLRRIGAYDYPDKWRYLGQAVFLARHKMNNISLAYQLADDLAKTYKPGMPAWAVQMRAIIASDMGEKEMAYNLMVDTLQTKAGGMDPAETNYMLDEICNRLLSPAQKATNSLCAGQ